ncbi:alpha/beta hydrolase [Alloalcanivorax mobilis]|uniref:alpha/beta hydrolase n=1 Tax=Alloalcanivorax mobilis TaxID=2019569 RepID=UPI000C75CDF7|nr:alpha/beta fold hydrolase [Alloalcanivorax mobilis]
MNTGQRVRFLSAGQACQGDLYLPETGDGAPRATVVMAHGFGLTRECGLAPFRDAFLAAGYAVFLFDYRHFGDSEGVPRQLLSPARQVADWQAALHALRGRAELDNERLILWGTSFAGGLVTAVAAREPRVAAIIAQCPMMDGLASVLEVIRYAGLDQGLKLTGLGLLDQARALIGMEPLYIASAGRPGEAAAMTSDDAFQGYTALMPEGVPNRVAARVALVLPLCRPVREAARVGCPALIQICENDTVAPTAAADRAVAAMPAARVRRYPVGHFQVYQGAARQRSIEDQLQFLAETVPAV